MAIDKKVQLLLDLHLVTWEMLANSGLLDNFTIGLLYRHDCLSVKELAEFTKITPTSIRRKGKCEFYCRERCRMVKAKKVLSFTEYIDFLHWRSWRIKNYKMAQVTGLVSGIERNFKISKKDIYLLINSDDHCKLEDNHKLFKKKLEYYWDYRQKVIELTIKETKKKLEKYENNLLKIINTRKKCQENIEIILSCFKEASDQCNKY